MSFVDCDFQGFGLFHLGYQICEHRVDHSVYYSFNVCGIYNDVPFFISDIYTLCLFSIFHSLVRGLAILLIFSKSQLLIFLIFSIDFPF